MDQQSVWQWVAGLARLTLRASQAMTLAWIITGILQARQCNLPEIALLAEKTTTLKHRIKRLSRFLGNDRIDHVTAYSPWLAKLLKRKKPIVMAFDWTQFRSLHTLALVGVFLAVERCRSCGKQSTLIDPINLKAKSNATCSPDSAECCRRKPK